MTATSPTHDDRDLAIALDQQVARLGLSSPEPPPGREATIAARRARRGAPPLSSLARVSLVRVDDRLCWVYERAPRSIGGRRAKRRSASLIAGQPVTSFEFEAVAPNQVIEGLVNLDASLTPERGLRRWNRDERRLEKAGAAAPTRGRTLLFVHGTFSKGDAFFEELATSAQGRDFLERAHAAYKGRIYSFDHPTLSVSPILNAFDLEEALARFEGKGEIDVICHSRGGLVVSWWLRTGARASVRKVVFAASPLEGTSLAAPARLKRALNGFADVANAMGKGMGAAATFVPPAQALLGVAAGLMKVLGGLLGVGARTPLLDAGVAIVPGLAAQSMVVNNQELTRLLSGGIWPSQPECHVVKSDFEPGDPNASGWQFWKRWRRPLHALADSAADVVFDGANDLVVDTGSMGRPLGIEVQRSRCLDFGTNNEVHHCNYFAQPRTAKYLIEQLGV